MTEPHAQYETHEHAQDDFGEVPFWKRAAITEGQYRRLLADLAIERERVKELTVEIAILKALPSQYQMALEVIAGRRITHDPQDLVTAQVYAARVLDGEQ